MKRLLLSLLLVFGLVSCGSAGGVPPTGQGAGSDEGTVYDPPKALNDFSLMSHTGKPVRFSDLKGRPTLVFFGFTHCPDVCPLTLTEWTKVKVKLGANANNVSFVFVSVDGARDTPPVLADYVAKYDPSFIGLTGDQGMVMSISRDFGSYVEVPTTTEESYEVVHGSYSFLVNEQGQLQKVYAYGMSADVISKDMLAMLQGS